MLDLINLKTFCRHAIIYAFICYGIPFECLLMALLLPSFVPSVGFFSLYRGYLFNIHVKLGDAHTMQSRRYNSKHWIYFAEKIVLMMGFRASHIPLRLFYSPLVCLFTWATFRNVRIQKDNLHFVFRLICAAVVVELIWKIGSHSSIDSNKICAFN